jgi:LytS/YehU family sensor histidine kinase
MPHDKEMHEPGPMGNRFDHEPPPEFRGEKPEFGGEKPEFRGEKFDRRPPAFIGEHDIVAIVIVILMCGMNLGIKLYFKTRNDQKKLLALEKENLEQQLEYLRYQINPHFFMNTLNNIHALVDIDPEKAKDTILELSKMMRFVLYEGDKKGVPLSREFDFIRHYVTLMQLRYTDKVRISVDLPQEAPDKQIPPLMLITFIENAFKHGISYQHESFIDVKVTVDDKLHFTCRNSKADKPNEEKGGVGLKNVKQRLNLLYDNNYTLNIQDEPDVYHVELTIPLL